MTFPKANYVRSFGGPYEVQHANGDAHWNEDLNVARKKQAEARDGDENQWLGRLCKQSQFIAIRASM